MASLENHLMSRVDAARGMMRFPTRRAEASGRLFVAKRCHEAAKAGTLDATSLEAILEEVQASLSDAAHDGAALEAEHIRRRLGSA